MAMFLSRIAIYFMKQAPAELHITVEYLNDSFELVNDLGYISSKSCDEFMHWNPLDKNIAL